MFLYTIPFFITLVSIFAFDINGYKKGKIIVWAFLYIYLLLLIGFRYRVGGDTINYMGYYEWQSDLENYQVTFGDIMQPGYNFLCAVTKSISPDFYVFQLLHSFIVNTLLFIFISKNTKYIFSALFVFFFMSYMNFTCEVMRESIAALIFAFLYKPLIQKKWMIYYLGVTLCMMFHLSAFILIIFPFLTWIKFNRKYLLLLICISLGMFFLNRVLILTQNVLIIGDKIADYTNETTHGLLVDSLKLLRLGLFPILFALLIKFGCHRKIMFENPIALLGLFGFMAFFNPVIFGRVINYLIIFFTLSFSFEIISLIKSCKSNLRHNAITLSLFFFILYGSGYTMYKVYQLYTPYSSIFNPVNYDRNIFNK